MAISAVGSRRPGPAAANVGGPGHGLPLLRRGPGGRRRPDPGPAPARHAAGRRRPVPGGRPRRAAGAAHRPPRSAGTAPGRCPSRRARLHPHGTNRVPHAHRLTARPGRGRRRPRRRARPGAPGRRPRPRRPVLTCVLVEGRDGSLRLAATDRYRLAVQDVTARAAGGTAAFRGLLPAATLGRWQSGLPDAGVLSVGVHGDHMVVRGEGVDLRALPVPATFPAYEDVLAAAGDAHAVVAGRDALHAALVAFADEPGAVLVRVTPGRLALVRRDRRWRSTPSTRDRTWTWRSTPPSQPMPWPRPGPDVVVEISGALRAAGVPLGRRRHVHHPADARPPRLT